MLITETHNFQPQRILKDSPVTFDSDRCQISIFYLPESGYLGGDAFTIDMNNDLVIGLLADMTGHGEEGRTQLQPYRGYLDKAVEMLKQGKHDLSNLLSKLDDNLGLENAIALSLVCETDGKLSYFNGGENKVYHCREGDLLDLNNPDIKLGWHRLFDQTPSGPKTLSLSINPADRPYLMSDGVADAVIPKDRTINQKIIDTLTYENNCHNAISQINLHIDKILGTSHINDDYTIIGLKRK